MEKDFENGDRRLTADERALRVKKMKKKSKRRLALVVTVFCLILLIVICPIILFASLRVRKFDMEGTSPYTPDEISAASGITVGKSLIFIDTEEIEKNIEKALPYIADVQVTKKLPGTLLIKYGEARKKYAIQISDTSYAVVSADFRVLETAAEPPEGTARIIGAPPAIALQGEIISFSGSQTLLDESGEPVNDASLSLLMEISKAVEESGLEDINMINITTVSHIYLIYNERIVLNLGDGSNIQRKLALGKKVIDSENENSVFQTGTINLTVDMQAYFSAEAYKDIPELLAYYKLIGKVTEEEEEETTEDGEESEETTDENGEETDEEESDEEETTESEAENDENEDENEG